MNNIKMRDNCTVKRLSESEITEYPGLKLFFVFQNGEIYCVIVLTLILQHNSGKGGMKRMANQSGKPIYVTWLKQSSLRTEHKVFPTAKPILWKIFSYQLY